MTGPKVLLYDLETAPLLGWTWGTYEQNVIRVKEQWRILCVGYKWLDEKTAHVVGIDDYQCANNDDRGVVEHIHALFEEADIIVAHNNDAFDEPKARARMIIHGMDPPIPYKTVDTLKLARRNFKFTSNKLDDVCQVLGIGRKAATGGFDTWLGCMDGDPAAWRKMKRYCKSDVLLLEQLYLRLRPWAERSPNLALYGDKPDACPKCGVVGRMSFKEYRYNAVTRRPLFRCRACRGIVAGRALEKVDVTHTMVP